MSSSPDTDQRREGKAPADLPEDSSETARPSLPGATATGKTTTKKKKNMVRMTQAQIDSYIRYQTVHIPEDLVPRVSKERLAQTNLADQGNLPVPMDQMDDYIAGLFRDINRSEARFMKERVCSGTSTTTTPKGTRKKNCPTMRKQKVEVIALVSDFFLGFAHGVAADASCSVGPSCFSDPPRSSWRRSRTRRPACRARRAVSRSRHAGTLDEDPPVTRFFVEEIGDSDGPGNSFTTLDEDCVVSLESFYVSAGARARLVGPLFLAAGKATSRSSTRN
ncbi:hypothetical protein PR202_gb13575 [Eleusine coracana subsp. coracana]|uniref:Uncharacterized protein n=1 Tax=Eleusine coracana subsp. coracana TaxID=191504 RepID=A0AAV5ESD2_ELECO|nr:hypothetical protein PR202_gb13575 [Eleusine coracana subsp. coracana]